MSEPTNENVMSDADASEQMTEARESVDHEAKAEGSPAVADSDKLTPEKLGELAVKFATDTLYAAAGFASVVAERAREYYDNQRKHLADKNPEGADPTFKAFVDSMPDQIKNLLDEVQKGYHDLAEKGRTVVNTRNQPRAKADAPGPFDIDSDSASASDQANTPGYTPVDPEQIS